MAQLYMLIDVTTPETTSVLRVTPLREIEQWGLIYKAQGRKVIAPAIEGKGFSKLEKLNLQYLYWNLTQQTPDENYGRLIQVCLETIQKMEPDTTSLEWLEKEVARLYPEPGQVIENGQETSQTGGNEVKKPRSAGATGRVWEIAEQLWQTAGNQMPDRKAVIAACVTAGINEATASTQYSKWKGTKTK